MGGSAESALLAAACSLVAGVSAGILARRDNTPKLAPDVEYLLRRAKAVSNQAGPQQRPAGGKQAAGSSSTGAGRRGGQPVPTTGQVSLDQLLMAMKETGAAAKMAALTAQAGGPTTSAPAPVPAPLLPPQPPAEAATGGLTKKDLEETMKSMLGPPGQQGMGDESALDRFTSDLTLSARMGKLDPVIGRDDEIRRCVHILSRRTKNNPVLIGESGVGKTALVEGLAQRIVAGDVPMALQGIKILELDLGSLTAGCMMPGEFEERLKAVLNEVQAMRGRVILFIDDIHNLVPAAGAAGATMMDGGALLKPALSRGELKCIGASSPDKFKKTIEKDPALERRFQQVMVDQPSVDQTISILRGLRPRYEKYHGVDISEGALVAAASLSARYISGRFLPDKAIDLMDEATAQVKMETTLKPEAQDVLERKVSQLQMEELSLTRKAQDDRTAAACLADIRAAKAAASEALSALKAAQRAQRDAEEGPSREQQEKIGALAKLSMEVDMLLAQADDADDEGDMEQAMYLRTHADALKAKVAEAREAAIKAGMPGTAAPPYMNGGGGMHPYGNGLSELMAYGRGQKRIDVMEGDVAKVISRWTGIPVAKLVAGEREKLLSLTDELHRRIIGQHEAVEAVAEAIQRSRADLADPNGPIASFMFLGPTGVGKTELAKALAAYLFNSQDALVRFDMSEYMEKHAVSRLIGSPPGYVGYDEGGMLTDAVRRRPYSVVLFDEIEKAHVDVFNVLLQILDDGRVTDTQGHTVSFKNVVIIMTSNLGSSEIFDQLASEEAKAVKTAAGESADAGDKANTAPLTHEERRLQVKTKVMEHVRSHFRPEFVNRVDDFITFEPLMPEQIKRIVVLRAQALVTRLAERRMKLQLADSAVEHLASVGFDPVFGARPVKRALQRELQTLLAKAVLRNEFEEDDTIVVEAAALGTDTTSGKPGDGNYRSGLVLRKGPKVASGTKTAATDGQQQQATEAAVVQEPAVTNGLQADEEDMDAIARFESVQQGAIKTVQSLRTNGVPGIMDSGNDGDEDSA